MLSVAVRRTFANFLTYLVVLLCLRLVFFIAFFRGEIAALPAGEMLRVFLLAERFDVSLASGVTLIDLSLRLLGAKTQQRVVTKIADWWFVLSLVAIVFLGVIAHYFFYYYKDRFNLFFWEFFISFENSKLVVFSIFDEIPVFRAFVLTLVLLILGFGLPKLVMRVRWSEKFATRFATPLGLVCSYLLLGFGCRATFSLPLPLQRMQGMASPYKPLNFIHGNAAYDLYQSYRMVFGRGNRVSETVRVDFSPQQAQQAFEQLQAEAPELRVLKPAVPTPELSYRAPGLGARYLKNKPKHIVYVLMESFGTWSFNSVEDDFGRKTSPFFNEFYKQGLYFDDYFAAGSGTIANIMKTVLQIHLPVNFPSEVTLSQSYRPFSTSLVSLAKALGYRTRFFYGGSLDWHNMEYMLPKVGFETVVGENSLPEVEHTRFGIYDRDLFDYVRKAVAEADETPTFDMVMTLSNHPPFRLPKHYSLVYDPQLPSLWKPFLKDEVNFSDRYRTQHYADWAMRDFIEKFKTQPSFNDTLFIFTADHANDGPFVWPDSDIYRTRKIPLLIYSPGLLLESPRIIQARGNHLDMGATLASLLVDEGSYELPSFGQSLLAPQQIAGRPLLSYELDCLEDVCLYQFKAYRLNEREQLVECAQSDAGCVELKEKIQARRKAFDTAGTQYFMQ